MNTYKVFHLPIFLSCRIPGSNSIYNTILFARGICLWLKHKVKIVRVLPNDSTRIADETSLLITDIVVELEDGTLANVEIQKIGYSFPGARSACYAADMLLRQYKRVRARQGENFSYKDIKNVFLIVIYEKSPKEFHEFSDTYFHHSRQVFDSGLKINLLQEYIMIPLDIFKRKMQNKSVTTTFEAWLTFLSEDRPERIISLIENYPEFKPMYETLYQLCQNTERVMGFFSEELRILDRNTVKYMIEQQQQEIDKQAEVIGQQRQELDKQEEVIGHQQQELDKRQEVIGQQQQELYQQQAQLKSLEEELEKLRNQLAES